jgi:hypothetical protein
MEHQEVFDATVRLQLRTQNLAKSVALFAPQIKDGLCGPDPFPEARPLRLGFLLSCLDETEEELRQVWQALEMLRWAMKGGQYPENLPESREAGALLPRETALRNGHSDHSKKALPATADDKSGAVKDPPAQIDFQRFRRLREPHVVEGAIEVTAQLRGEDSLVVLRLEALREADGAGYEVAVYRQETVQVASAYCSAGEPMRPLQEVRIWVAYDLIASVHSSPEAALEQVLGFLEMRCV